MDAAFGVSGMDSGGVYLMDETSGSLDFACHRGLSEAFVRAVSHYESDSPRAQLVAKGMPIYGRVDSGIAGLPPPVPDDGVRAIAVLPIRHAGRVIGCLNVASHTLEEVPIQARDALETIAAQIGGAIARLRAEEKIAWLARFPSESPNSILRVGEDGRVLYCNKAGVPLLASWGCREGEVLPDPWRRLVHDAMASGSVRHDEGQSGTRVFALNVVPIPQAGYANLYAMDITDLHQTQKLLHEAKEAAEAANRAKSEFLANMSHEIRTPMTAILGFADLLMAPNLPRREQREFLEAIQRNGRVLVELIDDILDLSRIEADQMHLEITDCSWRQIIDDVPVGGAGRSGREGIASRGRL